MGGGGGSMAGSSGSGESSSQTSSARTGPQYTTLGNVSFAGHGISNETIMVVAGVALLALLILRKKR
jgi:hypothetical protein